MKKILNWKDKSVVNIYDEVSLWSAPFGKNPARRNSNEKRNANSRPRFIPILYLEFKK